jgi:hypothetical protein
LNFFAGTLSSFATFFAGAAFFFAGGSSSPSASTSTSLSSLSVPGVGGEAKTYGIINNNYIKKYINKSKKN